MRAKDIMTRGVITVGPDTAVSEIAMTFLEAGISGAPVVDSKGAIVGLVSEGDLMRRVENQTDKRRSWWLELLSGPDTQAAEYVKSRGRKAQDVMSREVVTIADTASLREIANLLEKYRIKRVPVVHNGKLAGIVSRANLLQALACLNEGHSPSSASDAAIRAAVQRELDTQGWTSRGPQNIVVTDGVVHLWGFVRSEDERHAIKVAAENAPGTKGVKDHLNIERVYTSS
jgi:CBS domain-containing protein